MATYRVSLARRKKTAWDWRETVTAIDGDTALGEAHANWLATQPRPVPPPLDRCHSEVVKVGIAGMPGGADGT